MYASVPTGMSSRFTNCPDCPRFSEVILRCHSDVDLATSVILIASSNWSLMILLSKYSFTSSNASPSLPPSARIAAFVAMTLASEIVVAL